MMRIRMDHARRACALVLVTWGLAGASAAAQSPARGTPPSPKRDGALAAVPRTPAVATPPAAYRPVADVRAARRQPIPVVIQPPSAGGGPLVPPSPAAAVAIPTLPPLARRDPPPRVAPAMAAATAVSARGPGTDVPPTGATARCKDGSYLTGNPAPGRCGARGGVAVELAIPRQPTPPPPRRP